MILVSVSRDWSWSQSHETGLSLSLGLEFYPLLGLGLSLGLEFLLTLVSVSVSVSNFGSLWSQSRLGLKKVGLADLCCESYHNFDNFRLLLNIFHGKFKKLSRKYEKIKINHDFVVFTRTTYSI